MRTIIQRTKSGTTPASPLPKMPQDIERRLIKRYQHGDSEAAWLLIQQHDRALHYIASTVTSRCESPEDLFQQACVAFLISVSKYRLRHKAKPRITTWCYHHVRRELHKHCLMAGVIRLPSLALTTDRAAAERAMRAMSRDCLDAHPAMAREYDDQQIVDDAEERELFDRALRRLNSRQREIVEWRLLGWTLKDIGDTMGLTKERVRQILDKALERLSLYCHRQPALLG